MRLLLLAFCLPLLAGCKTTTFTESLANGGTLTFKDSRFIFATEARITATVHPTNGLQSITVEVKGKPDAEFIKAVAEGTAEGVVKGLGAVAKGGL